MNLLDNTANQASKFTTKKWVKISDDSSGTDSNNIQTKCKTTVKIKFMLL